MTIQQWDQVHYIACMGADKRFGGDHTMTIYMSLKYQALIADSSIFLLMTGISIVTLHTT